MSKVLKVNWTQLGEMGKRTLKNSQDFEEARANFQKIVNSLSECWEGIDADAFHDNCNEFLEDLKKDSMYLEALGMYFDQGSRAYSTTIETHAKKIEKMNQELADEEERMEGVL